MRIRLAKHWVASLQERNLRGLYPVDKSLAERISKQAGVDVDFDRLKLMEVDTLPADQKYQIFGNVIAVHSDHFRKCYSVGSEDIDPDEQFFLDMIGDYISRQNVGFLEKVRGFRTSFGVVEAESFPVQGPVGGVHAKDEFSNPQRG